MDKVAGEPIAPDSNLAKLPAEPLVVKVDTVVVVLCSSIKPVVNPALLTASVLKVFQPLIKMLSPEQVILL